MENFTAANIIFSFIITWTIGLAPPAFLRYGLLKHSLSKKSAIVICLCLWIFNIFLFTLLGSKSKIHGALILIAFASYWLLTQGKPSQFEPTAEAALKQDQYNDYVNVKDLNKEMEEAGVDNLRDLEEYRERKN